MIDMTPISLSVSNIRFCCDFRTKSLHFFFRIAFFFQMVGRGKRKLQDLSSLLLLW